VPIFGEKVSDLRRDRSQQAFATTIGLSVDVIQRAERGEATIRTIRKICKYARSKNPDLTTETLQKNPPPKAAKR
jgi:hypothetical protein